MTAFCGILSDMPVAADFSFPTTILFGAGRVGEIRDRLAAMGVSRPLIVTDAGLFETPAFRKCSRPLRAHHVFSAVQSNPPGAGRSRRRRRTSAAVRQRDRASAAGARSTSRRSSASASRSRTGTCDDPPPDGDVGPLAPFIAIPTTAGTGSEVGRSSVITIGGTKRVIFHPSLLANLVILDPQLTVDLPPKLTAATGADALTHCIESFTSPEFHPLCDGIALEGHSPDRRGAAARGEAAGRPRRPRQDAGRRDDGRHRVPERPRRCALARAPALGACAACTTGSPTRWCCPAVMRFNARRKPELYHRVGLAMGKLDASRGRRVRCCREIGIDARRSAQPACATISSMRWPTRRSPDTCHKTNPVPVTRDDLLQLYQEAM